ncbi:MAG: 50S ribosomal protein L25 [Acidobacteria bacterium]|nr:50S ribosomal protein L25 [Acidobacteriota bacterium]
MSANIVLDAKSRVERGKNAMNRLRADGLVPVTVYGGSESAVSTSIVKREFTALLRHYGRNKIIYLNIDGVVNPVKIAELQIDPIKSTLIHADLVRIFMNDITTFNVPIKIIGEPEGVKHFSGVLDVVTHELEIECLPGDLPDSIVVDVTPLNIGDHFDVSDIKLDEKVKIMLDPSTVIATVVSPRAEEEAASSAEAPAEPEVIKKGKTEES